MARDSGTARHDGLGAASGAYAHLPTISPILRLRFLIVEETRAATPCSPAASRIASSFPRSTSTWTASLAAALKSLATARKLAAWLCTRAMLSLTTLTSSDIFLSASWCAGASAEERTQRSERRAKELSAWREQAWQRDGRQDARQRVARPCSYLHLGQVERARFVEVQGVVQSVDLDGRRVQAQLLDV